MPTRLDWAQAGRWEIQLYLLTSLGRAGLGRTEAQAEATRAKGRISSLNSKGRRAARPGLARTGRGWGEVGVRRGHGETGPWPGQAGPWPGGPLAQPRPRPDELCPGATCCRTQPGPLLLAGPAAP